MCYSIPKVSTHCLRIGNVFSQKATRTLNSPPTWASPRLPDIIPSEVGSGIEMTGGGESPFFMLGQGRMEGKGGPAICGFPVPRTGF